MAYAEQRGEHWRVKYEKPNEDWASESGFETKKSGLDWGRDQETGIRRSTWIDPKHAQVRFGTFAEQVFPKARLAINTRAKYRSYLDRYLLSQWEDHALGAIFNDHQEIEGWVKDLHGDLTRPPIATFGRGSGGPSGPVTP